jgi:ribosomal protein S18 acetylase RimI-like enzyme
MTPDEFRRRSAKLRGEYADDLRTARSLTAADALAEAARQMTELLPHGVDTPRALIWTVQVDPDATAVGWLWVTLPDGGGGARAGMAWIHNIEVDADQRSRGYGAAILDAMEAELAARGVYRVGLNVFGHNPQAIRLYERHGFQVTAQQMAKDILRDGTQH